jgi:DNA-binding transcriptional LysR family regulator
MGMMTFNGTAQLLNGTLAGCGLAYVAEGLVEQHVAKGRLKRVPADWCPSYSGYHLFYPSRSQSSAAFALVVKALRSQPSQRIASQAHADRQRRQMWHGNIQLC